MLVELMAFVSDYLFRVLRYENHCDRYLPMNFWIQILLDHWLMYG